MCIKWITNLGSLEGLLGVKGRDEISGRCRKYLEGVGNLRDFFLLKQNITSILCLWLDLGIAKITHWH